MEAANESLVMDARRLHDALGVDLDQWAELIGHRIEHATFGVGCIKTVNKGGPNNLRVAIEFPGGTKTLSSANLGTQSLLIARSDRPIPATISVELMTREGLVEQTKRLAISQEIAAKEVRERAERERQAAQEFAESLAKGKEEQEAQRVEAEQERLRNAAEWAARREQQLKEIESLRERVAARLNDELAVPNANVLLGDHRLHEIVGRMLNSLILSARDLQYLENVEQYRLLACFYTRRFETRHDPWDAIKACGHWKNKKCGHPERTLELSENVLNGSWPQIDDSTRLTAAAWTTHGAAFNVQGRLEEARNCAATAIRIKESFHPHRVLGSVCYKQGRFEEGLAHFQFACELDKDCTDFHSQIRSEMPELRDYDPESARRAAEWMLSLDRVKYGWAKKYL